MCVNFWGKREMAKEQKGRGSNRAGSRKKPTMESNKKSKKKNGGRDERESEATHIVPTSSSDSQNNDNNVDHEEQVEESEDEDVVLEDDEEEETNQRSNSNMKRGDDDDGDSKKKTSTKKKTKKKEVEEKRESPLYQFPMHRVNRMMKSEDPGIRISQEAVFLINKASERFLNLFTTEAYAAAFLERKKFVGYQHLSSVVTKRKRFDFLSDFVPEKMKAEDALKELPSIEP